MSECPFVVDVSYEKVGQKPELGLKRLLKSHVEDALPRAFLSSLEDKAWANVSCASVSSSSRSVVGRALVFVWPRSASNSDMTTECRTLDRALHLVREFIFAGRQVNTDLVYDCCDIDSKCSEKWRGFSYSSTTLRFNVTLALDKVLFPLRTDVSCTSMSLMSFSRASNARRQ